MTPVIELDAEDLEAAAALADAAIDRLLPVAGGGNNRLYRVEGADGRVFALKTYLRQPQDRRDRLGAETQALAFLWQHGVRAIPQLIAVDRDGGRALFDWIAGQPVGEAEEAEIDAAIGFVAELAQLARLPAARRLPLASEACLSGFELVRQIDRRYDRLKQEGRRHRPLGHFLDYHFAPAFARAAAGAASGYRAAGFDFEQPLAEALQTLSPSDFGFHNALRRADGRLVFLDFEYFGRDDPVKLVADFLLHPGMHLSPPLKRRFLQGVGPLFARDPGFATRLRLLYPLYSLRWVMIVLNEFLPERWQRRAYAGETARKTAEARQLAKAEDLLWRLANHGGGFPDDA